MMQSKLWEDVNEGDELPDLVFGPMTIKSFMLMFAGTRDPNPQHHNREWNIQAGSRDIFATTPWHQALFARFVTDWSGPDSDFRSTTLGMGIQVCPGDTVTVKGKVAKKYQEAGDYRVLIDITSQTDHGVAARATATLAMPSRKGGDTQVLRSVPKLRVEPHPEMPEWARPHLRQVSPKNGPTAFPVSETQLWYWCEMIENGNPLYTDPEYASGTRHEGIVAPGPSLMVWTFGHASQSPDVDNPEHQPWPPVDPNRSRGGGGYLEPPNAPFVIATNLEQHYGVPMRPGDRFWSTSEFVNCTPEKRTHLGIGYFTTSMTTYYNQNDEIVANHLFTLYRYRRPD
jgi:hypothetical protein